MLGCGNGPAGTHVLACGSTGGCTVLGCGTKPEDLNVCCIYVPGTCGRPPPPAGGGVVNAQPQAEPTYDPAAVPLAIATPVPAGPPVGIPVASAPPKGISVNTGWW